jgi:hypothetical protein
MKLHPAECNYSLNQKLSSMLKESMEKNKVLPKDPRRNKKFKDWVEKNGFKLGLILKRTFHVFRIEGHVGVWIECIPPKTPQWQRRKPTYKVHIDIPYDLADRMLALGFGP